MKNAKTNIERKEAELKKLQEEREAKAERVNWNSRSSKVKRAALHILDLVNQVAAEGG